MSARHPHNGGAESQCHHIMFHVPTSDTIVSRLGLVEQAACFSSDALSVLSDEESDTTIHQILTLLVLLAAKQGLTFSIELTASNMSVLC
jgi:hypothetical protein